MTLRDLSSLMPLMILAASAVAVLIATAIRRSHGAAFALALGGTGLALLSLPAAAPSPTTGGGGSLFLLDGYARLLIALILMAGLATLLLGFGYLKIRRGDPEEFYILILTALLGAAILAGSVHLAAFFLGLEILSVSLYALIAYDRMNDAGLEAGIKYLVLAAFSSATLAFGMALVYADAGALSFSRVAVRMAAGAGPVLFAGMILIATGIGFKLAVVPFHMWAADVYEGAPAPVTAFIATVSKGAVFAVLLRFFVPPAGPGGNAPALFLAAVAMASMIAGNLLALFQDNVKRLLAYSSIAHMGYLLVAFLAGGPLRVTAALFYLMAYFISSLGAFGVVTLLSNGRRDADRLDDYRGLFARRPWLAGAFTAMLLSLAGIPLTAGFIGKFYVLAAGVGSFLWVPVGTLVITSVIGLVYYLRVLMAMYTPPPAAGLAVPAMPAGALALVILTALLLGLGIYPGPVLETISVLGASG